MQVVCIERGLGLSSSPEKANGGVLPLTVRANRNILPLHDENLVKLYFLLMYFRDYKIV